MNEFHNFDEFYHKITNVTVDHATYQICHQKGLSGKKVREIAERIHEDEMKSGEEPSGLYGHDFRNL